MLDERNGRMNAFVNVREKFTRHLYILYGYKINIQPKLGRQTYIKKVSSYLSRNAESSLRVEEIVINAKNKSDWKLTRPSDDDDDDVSRLTAKV